MKTAKFNDRTVAHRWAARQRVEKADRLVMACEECPPPKRSRRKPPRPSVIASKVAAALGGGVNLGAIRKAVAVALKEERQRGDAA